MGYKKPEKWLTRLKIFLALFFITIPGIELSLRFLRVPELQYFRDIKLLHIYHPDYRVGLAPGLNLDIRHYNNLWSGKFTTNSLGYRGSPEPNPDSSQIVCLGDSIVMGFGVSDGETFCSLLNDISIGEKTFQAMNLGVDAFGTKGSAIRLEEAAEKLNIDTALFIVSPNDYTMAENLRAAGELSDDEKDEIREKINESDFLFRTQFELTRVSYFLHALKLSLEQLRLKWFQTKMGAIEEMEKMGLLKSHSQGRFKTAIHYILNSFYRFPPKSECDSRKAASSGEGELFICPEPVRSGTICEDPVLDGDIVEPLPEITVKYYKKMIETSRKKGFRLIPVLLPIQDQVLQCYQNRMHSSRFNYALRAKNFFEKEGIQTMDLRPYIREMCGSPFPSAEKSIRPSKIQDYFIPGDGHFTVYGNRWAADSIRRELVKNYLFQSGESR